MKKLFTLFFIFFSIIVYGQTEKKDQFSDYKTQTSDKQINSQKENFDSYSVKKETSTAKQIVKKPGLKPIVYRMQEEKLNHPQKYRNRMFLVRYL